MYIDNNDFSAYDCILFRTALSDPKLFDILNKFKVLSNNKLIKLSEMLYSYYKKNKSLPDFEYFKDLIPDKPGYEDITKTIEINDATLQAFHDTVHKLSFQSAVINIAENALNADKDYTTENLIKDVRNATYEYQDKVDDRFELSSYKSILDIVRKHRERKERYLSSGYKHIDEVLNTGGWKPGNTYCVMGLTGTGKSIFLCNFAVQSMKSGYKTLYISTEMDHIKICDRILCSYFGEESLEAVGLRVQNLMKAQEEIMGIIEVIKVHPNDTSCSDIQSEIDNMSNKPDIVIIDYADELRATEKVANEYDKHGIVASDLKRLAEINNMPVITATQTNRTAEGQDGGTKDWVGMYAVADSQKKVRILDVLFSIKQTIKDKDRHQIYLDVVKNRYGRCGIQLPFKINYKTMRITEDNTVQDFKNIAKALQHKESEQKSIIDIKRKEGKKVL